MHVSYIQLTFSLIHSSIFASHLTTRICYPQERLHTEIWLCFRSFVLIAFQFPSLFSIFCFSSPLDFFFGVHHYPHTAFFQVLAFADDILHLKKHFVYMNHASVFF